MSRIARGAIVSALLTAGALTYVSATPAGASSNGGSANGSSSNGSGSTGSSSNGGSSNLPNSNGFPGSTTCKSFTGPKWVNPYPPHEVGHHYQVIVIGTSFTCTAADAYVVKFIAQKIKPLKSNPLDGKVTGGPAGYKCTSGIANNHTAYQGNCLNLDTTLSSSSFSWGPYNDS